MDYSIASLLRRPTEAVASVGGETDPAAGNYRSGESAYFAHKRYCYSVVHPVRVLAAYGN